jgi:hypothetical protein
MHPLEASRRLTPESVSVSLAPAERTRWKSNRVLGVKPFSGEDRDVEIHYTRLVEAIEQSGAFPRIVKNYRGPELDGEAGFVLDVEIRPTYSVDRGKNLLIQWPGFLAMAPLWHGLVYTLELDSRLEVRDSGEKELLASTNRENYEIRYTSTTRGVMTGFPVGYFFFGSLSLLSNVYVEWSDPMRTEANLKVSRDFSLVLSERLLSSLSVLPETQDPP